jgi:hypothetical protein
MQTQRKERERCRTPDFHTLLVFRCPTTLSEALADQAVRQGTSVSAVIRDLLRSGLKGAVSQ